MDRGGASGRRLARRDEAPHGGHGQEVRYATMTNKPAYQPENYQSVIPYLHVNGAAKLITFMKEVFDAKEIAVYPRPDGTEGHAALRIGDSVIELSDSSAEWPVTPCAIQVKVHNTHAA